MYMSAKKGKIHAEEGVSLSQAYTLSQSETSWLGSLGLAGDLGLWGFPFPSCQQLASHLLLPMLSSCPHQSPPSPGNRHRVQSLD